MRRHTSIILIMIILNLVIVLAGQKHSFDLSALTEKGRLSHQGLLSSQIFALGPVGFGSAMSDDEQALRTLLSEDHAVPALENLLSDATTEGKMYALYGLYVKDREVFKQELHRYKKERGVDGSVNTQSGCIVMPEQENAVLSRIETGQYDPFKTSSVKN